MKSYEIKIFFACGSQAHHYNAVNDISKTTAVNPSFIYRMYTKIDSKCIILYQFGQSQNEIISVSVKNALC